MKFYFISTFPLQPGLKNAFNNNAVQISSDISLIFLAKSQTAEITCNNQNKVIYLFTGIFGCKIKWYILINVEVYHYELRMGPW